MSRPTAFHVDDAHSFLFLFVLYFCHNSERHNLRVIIVSPERHVAHRFAEKVPLNVRAGESESIRLFRGLGPHSDCPRSDPGLIAKRHCSEQDGFQKPQRYSLCFLCLSGDVGGDSCLGFVSTMDLCGCVHCRLYLIVAGGGWGKCDIIGHTWINCDRINVLQRLNSCKINPVTKNRYPSIKP